MKNKNNKNKNNFENVRQAWNAMHGVLGSMTDLERIILEYWYDQPVWQLMTHPHSGYLSNETWSVNLLSPTLAYVRGKKGDNLVEYHVDEKTQEIIWNPTTHFDLKQLLPHEYCPRAVGVMGDECFAAVYDEGKDQHTRLVFFNIREKGRIRKEFPLTKRYSQFIYMPKTHEICARQSYVKELGKGYPTDILNADNGTIKTRFWPINDQGSYFWIPSHNNCVVYLNSTGVRDRGVRDLIFRATDIKDLHAVRSCGGGFEDKDECWILNSLSMTEIDQIPLGLADFPSLPESWFRSVIWIDDHRVLLMNARGYSVLSFVSPVSVLQSD
jgi:hypothetical protein